MRLIALDTATGVPTVCLWLGDGEVLHWRGEPRPGPDSVLAGARGLLDGASLDFSDLDAVACGRGPGAFTGVRLAITLAQGLALGAGCRLIAVSELEALAWRAHRKHGWERVLACLDARQNEVYWAPYECEREEPRALGPEALDAPNRVVFPAGEWALAGSGAALLDVTAERDTDAVLAPDAEAIANLAAIKFARGETLSPASLEASYLRDRVAMPKSGISLTQKIAPVVSHRGDS